MRTRCVYELIKDLDILGVRLQQARIPFDAGVDKKISTSIGAHGSLEVRTQKWQHRIKILQKLLDASPCGVSGGPPGVSAVTAFCAPSLEKGPVLFQSHALPAGTRAPAAAMEGRVP